MVMQYDEVVCVSFTDVEYGMAMERSTLYDRSVMYSVHCTLYNLLCTLYSVHCIVYNVQCAMYSVQCTVFIKY